MFFSRKSRNRHPKKSNSDIVYESCGINPNNANISDYFVYGIVHYPFDSKNEFEYLSSNDCMLIDETIIAYKIAKYRLERALLLNHLRDDEFMLSIADRVKRSLSNLYDIPYDLISAQWKNRNKLLKLLYIGSESSEMPAFYDSCHFVLSHDYIDKTYIEITSDSPVAIINFDKDIIFQSELHTFINVFNSMMCSLVDSIDLK